MRKERDIIVKVIENKNINNKRLADFFAKKYGKRYIEKQNTKS